MHLLQKALDVKASNFADFVCLFVCFVALRPKSTAMVIAERSVHLTTLFSWASLNKQLTSNRAHTFACNWQQPFMNDSAEGRRMTVESISWSISTKVWDRAGIELATPGSAVSFASVTRHVTYCATRPGKLCRCIGDLIKRLSCDLDRQRSKPKPAFSCISLTVWRLFVLLLYLPVNSYGHGGTVSSSNHFFPGQAWTSS